MPFWQKGIDEYTAAHSNVTVTVESTPWGEYWTKLNSQIAADAQADIIGMVSMNSDFFIRNGALLNMSPYITAQNFDISDFWPGMMEAYTVDGGVYCLPYDVSAELLLCNLDIFSEMGVEFKPEGYSMDEFIRISKKLTNSDHYASSFYPSGWVLYDFIYGAGVNPVDSSGNIALNKPEAVAVIQWLADLFLIHGTQARFDRGADEASLFTAQRIAMMEVNPEWVMKLKTDMPNAKLDVMNLPFIGINGGKRVTEGGSFSISSKTKHPDVAWDFLKNYTSSENLGEIIGASHRGIPGRASSAPRMLESPLAVPHSSLFFDVMNGSTWINYPFRTECETELANVMDRIYLGQVTAKQGMDEFMQAVKDIQSR
jgi:multiple sugar transport system substrate-binding protein